LQKQANSYSLMKQRAKNTETISQKYFTAINFTNAILVYSDFTITNKPV